MKTYVYVTINSCFQRFYPVNQNFDWCHSMSFTDGGSYRPDVVAVNTARDEQHGETEGAPGHLIPPPKCGHGTHISSWKTRMMTAITTTAQIRMLKI